MKNSNKHILTVIFLFLALSGCGVEKFLTRNSARTKESNEIEMISFARKDQSSFSEEALLFSDSGRHSYQVMIFPQDSFSFSVEDGFRGKAQKIEILGSSEHLAKGEYYQLNLESKSADSSVSFKENSTVAERVIAKNLEKRHRTGILLVIIACIIIAACCWWRFDLSNRF